MKPLVLAKRQKLDHIAISLVIQFDALGSIIENDENIVGDVNFRIQTGCMR